MLTMRLAIQTWQMACNQTWAPCEKDQDPSPSLRSEMAIMVGNMAQICHQQIDIARVTPSD